MIRRIHLNRNGVRAYLRPNGAAGRWALCTADGAPRAAVDGTAAEARKEAKRIIDQYPECFTHTKEEK